VCVWVGLAVSVTEGCAVSVGRGEDVALCGKAVALGTLLLVADGAATIATAVGINVAVKVEVGGGVVGLGALVWVADGAGGIAVDISLAATATTAKARGGSDAIIVGCITVSVVV